MTIELVFAACDPPEGCLRAEDGETRCFAGWLGLLRALSDLIGADAASALPLRDDIRRELDT